MRKLLPLFLLGSLFFFPQPSLAASGNLGTNLGGINYWDGIVPFNNIVRQGGEWIGQRPAATDKNGWPTKITEPMSMALAEVQYPAGSYTVRGRGKGTFSVAGKSFSGKNGNGSVALDGSSLVLLVISSTDSRDHLRNIEVLVPGAKSGENFRAKYLQQLQPYNTLRFMDWQKTNGTFADPVPLQSCRSATKQGAISQGRRRGAAVAWMVALANRLSANPWFSVPHRATASWLRCHARYVATHLRKSLVPRYEFSNETWNPAFEQFFAMEDAGAAAGLGGGDSYLGLQLEVGRRHNRMAAVVKPVMRNHKRRAIFVLAGQAANAWVMEQRLSVAAGQTDEIAIAPYMHLQGLNAFEPGDGAAIVAMSESEILANLQDSLDTETDPWTQDHLDLADASGKRLVAYEGGQHLAGDSSNDAATALFVAANRNQGMGELYDQYLQRWKALTNNGLFVHYTDAGPYSQYGSWGALESPDQGFATSPKYQALLRFVAG